MAFTFRSLGFALFLTAVPALAQPKPAPATLFQVSTLDALLSGIYDGSFTLAQILQHGDFGLGTFEGVDGEMMVLNGRVYQMRANGLLTEADESARVPFAAVTTFQPDVQFSVRQVPFATLYEMIDGMLPSKNLFYAIKLQGTFSTLTTRSIFKQFLPYPPLADLIPTQSTFESTNIKGAAIGFRSPAFVSGINQPGYHFHFVSDDRKMGGHALSFIAGEVTVQVQILRRHTILLPDNEPFLKATLPLPQN